MIADTTDLSALRGAVRGQVIARGEPGYDAALTAIAGRAALSDPPGAARLFDSINVAEAPDAPQTAARITSEWARRDHRAAAGWAAAPARSSS